MTQGLAKDMEPVDASFNLKLAEPRLPFRLALTYTGSLHYIIILLTSRSRLFQQLSVRGALINVFASVQAFQASLNDIGELSP